MLKASRGLDVLLKTRRKREIDKKRPLSGLHGADDGGPHSARDNEVLYRRSLQQSVHSKRNREHRTRVTLNRPGDYSIEKASASTMSG